MSNLSKSSVARQLFLRARELPRNALVALQSRLGGRVEVTHTESVQIENRSWTERERDELFRSFRERLQDGPGRHPGACTPDDAERET